jgi:hypothetical protein
MAQLLGVCGIRRAHAIFRCDAEEQSVVIQRALLALGRRDDLGARALVGRYVDGYTQREIAILYGAHPSAVCRALKRAERVFEELIEDEIHQLRAEYDGVRRRRVAPGRIASARRSRASR